MSDHKLSLLMKPINIPMEIAICPSLYRKVRLEHFYKIVGLLNRTLGKSKWKGPKHVVKKIKQWPHRGEVHFTAWMPEDKKEEIKFLMKLTF